MKAQKKNQTKTKNSDKNNFLTTLSSALSESGDIDSIIETVELKKGRTGFQIFLAENYKKEKTKDKNVTLASIIKKTSEKWSKLLKNEKEKYEKLSEEEKEKYKHDLNIIKHYFFSEFHKYGSTAYRIFLNERLKTGFEKDENVKETKKKAMEDWNKMSQEEKNEWKKKKRENDTWWEKAKSLKNVTPYSVFIQKNIEEAKDKNENIAAFKALAKIWSHLSNKEKNKYYDIANEINEERKKRRDLYEIVHGIRPKRPAGAYKIFLSEKAKEGLFKGKVNVLKEGRKLWENLNEDDKNLYLRKARRIKLCYMYRKILYKKNVKHLLPKKPGSAYTCFLNSIKGIKIPEGKIFMEIAREKWDKMNKKEREKFEQKALEEKVKYEKKMKNLESKVFDEPKKPKTSFSFFLMEKISEIKSQDKNLTFIEVIRKAGKEWKDLSNKQKEKYIKKNEKDKERFRIQMKEFLEKGFYSIKVRSENGDSNTSRITQKSLSEKKRSSKSRNKSQRKSAKK